jgi:polyhydroxyalkanoate synthesis regulator phasin
VESEYQDQIKKLVAKLERGEIGEAEFQRLLDDLVGAIGKESATSDEEETVKRERLRQDAQIVRTL